MYQTVDDDSIAVFAFADYEQRTTRTIPVIILERAA
jgi:hypothetical protein